MLNSQIGMTISLLSSFIIIKVLTRGYQKINLCYHLTKVKENLHKLSTEFEGAGRRICSGIK